MLTEATRDTTKHSNITRLAIVALLALAMAGAASAAGNASIEQTGDTIYVWGANKWANLTDLQSTVNNNTALSVSGTEFLLNSNIYVNDTTTTLYINNTDTSWLKINSTGNFSYYINVNGSLYINNTKITSWNTTNSDVVTSTGSTVRGYIRYGQYGNTSTGVKLANGTITNSYIGYLGYGTLYNEGISFWKWQDRIDNVTFENLHSLQFRRYDDNVYINNSRFYNFTSTVIDMWVSDPNANFTINNSVINTSNLLIDYEGGVASTAANIYNTVIESYNGTAVHQNSGANSTYNNVTIPYGRYSAFELRDNASIINTTATNCPDKSCLYLVNNNSVPGLWNMTIYNGTGDGVRIYIIKKAAVVDLTNITINGHGFSTYYPLSVQASDNLYIDGLHIYNNTAVDMKFIPQTTNTQNITFNDVVTDDKNFSFWWNGCSNCNINITDTNNYILNNTVNFTEGEYTNTSSRIPVTSTAPAASTVYVNILSSTLRPNENSTKVKYYANDTIIIDYQNFTIQFVNFTLASITKMNVTATNISNGTTYYLYYAGNSTQINTTTASGSVIHFNDSLGVDSYILSNTQISGGSAGAIPPAPINLTNTTGNYWVNHTWQAGAGNVTNSFNVSQNGTWTNGSANTYFNASVGASGWSNITVFAWNNSGTGTLSLTGVSMNTQAPAAPALGNYNVSGYISNTLGLMLENARIDLGNSFNFTDANGYYSVQNISGGTHTVLARAIGYRNATNTTEITGDTVINFTLNERAAGTVSAPNIGTIASIFIFISANILRRKRI